MAVSHESPAPESEASHVQLRARGEKAVISGNTAGHPIEVDPRKLAIDNDLVDLLHEWAKVAAAVQRARLDDFSGERAPHPEVAVVVSSRGRQLAGRVATALSVPVRYLDPVTETVALVQPRSTESRWRDSTNYAETGPEPAGPTPWATGLVAAGFVAVVVIVALVALADALSSEAGGWLAIAAVAIVTGGLAPSLWLARKVLIVRWLALGATIGVGLSWIGVLVIAL